MKKYRFTWIDDQQSKIDHFRAAIEAGPRDRSAQASVESVEVLQDFLPQLTNWARDRQGKTPHLILIDHIFLTAQPFGLKGSSVAHLLRNSFPLVPMVCVTGMLDKADAFDQEDLSEYTAIFPYTQLEKAVDDLFAISRDFPKLHCATGDLREHLVSCLKAPKRDKEDLRRLLPDEFQTQRHATTEHRIARWIFNVLLRKAGFLYDRLNTATLLGLTTQGFTKVERTFEQSLYKGVFASPSRPVWWASELRRQLYDTLGERASDIPQLAGRMLPEIVPADYSVCYVSKKAIPPPDSVVYADATRDAKQHVVQRQYADRHPKDSGMAPGFETDLVLKRKGAP